MIESSEPLLPPERAWRVDETPVVTVGAGEERAANDTLYEFNQINGASFLADGRFVVAVMGSHALRFFDQAGVFTGSAGRQGDGPGEFRQIIALYRIRGDTLIVHDNHYDLEWFTGKGTPIPDPFRGRMRDELMETALVLGDGTPLAVEFSHFDEEGAHLRRKLRVLRLDRSTQRIDTLGVYPGILQARRIPGIAGEYALAFTPTAVFLARDDTLITGNSSQYQFDVRTRDGTSIRAVRRAWSAAEIGDSLRSRWKEFYLNRRDEYGRPFSEMWKRQQRAFLDSDPFPTALPAFLHVVVSREGDLWVQRFDIQSVFRQTWSIGTQSLDVPTVWDVFARDGRWLTTVELPARYTLLDVAGDRLLGLVQNTDEEQGVQLLRLIKP